MAPFGLKQVLAQRRSLSANWPTAELTTRRRLCRNGKPSRSFFHGACALGQGYSFGRELSPHLVVANARARVVDRGLDLHSEPGVVRGRRVLPDAQPQHEALFVTYFGQPI